MVGIELEGSVLNTPFDTFATSLFHLYSGPTVKISVESASHEYIIPKALLCTQVSYFADMFQEQHFREGAELSTELGKIDGVVSTRSVEMLVQWVCHNRIVFRDGDSSPAEAIAASIEFARFADMCRITGLETMMAKHIKKIILANKPPPESVFVTPLDEYSYHLTLEHIESSVLLPRGHAVRKLLVSATV